jgi:hypothetical protein
MKTASILALVLAAGTAVAQHNPANASAYSGTIGQGQDFNNGGGQRSNVIYSTLNFQSSQSYDAGNGNAWSGTAIFGSPQDLQLADDFTTTGDNVITQVTADYVTFLAGTPAGGLQVDVWTDTGAGPGSLVASQTVPVSAASSWTDTIFGLAGRRLTGNVNIPLAANTDYYIMIQPVDLTASGDWYYQIRDLNSFIGGDSYGRDGGRGGAGYGTTVWTSMTSFGFGTGDTGMEIRAVPAPGALALLGLGGLAAARRRR